MANVYDDYKVGTLNGTYDWDEAAQVDCLLLRSDGVTPTYVSTHEFVQNMLDHAQNTEIAVGGYARVTSMAGKSVTETTGFANGLIAKAVFTSLAAGADVGAAVLYRFITNDAASPLIAFFDVTNTATNGGDIEIRWNGTDGNGIAVRLAE